MHVLLVDDDESFVDAVAPEIEKIVGPGNLALAKSRDGSITALNAGSYDLFVLDLKIPSTDGSLDEAVEHGQAVFHHAHQCSPRTPVYFLTGSSADAVVTDLLRHAEQVDVWGDGRPIPTVQLLRKTHLPELLDELRSVSKCVGETDDIEIVTYGQDLQLTSQQKRVLRVFTRRRGGSSCTVSVLAGGLSGSRVFRIVVRNFSGVVQIIAAGKLANIEMVDDEVVRFDRYVQHLRPGVYPQKVEVVRAGAKRTGGVFYWLLQGYEHSLISLVGEDPARAGEVVARLQDLTGPWTDGVPTSQKQVAEIRRRLVPDDVGAELAATYRLSWADALETKWIQTRWACVHGDLHGGNVLVGGELSPMLIDFADVGLGAAAIDPMTLELSLIFHPDLQRVRGNWPSSQDASSWADAHRYVQSCPCATFVQACRKWSHSVAGGDREVYAAAYAYLLRQLKYADTDKQLVLCLIEAVRRSLEATYG
jgi:CheY-like chemotaxis protein